MKRVGRNHRRPFIKQDMIHSFHKVNQPARRGLAGIMGALTLFSFIVGCAELIEEPPTNNAPDITPTINTLFVSEDISLADPVSFAVTETITSLAGSGNSVTQQISSTLPLTKTPAGQPNDPQSTTEPFYIPITIYDEALNTDWVLEESESVDYELYHWRHFRDGAVSIAATPLEAEGSLYFTVADYAQIEYMRAEIVGLRFWINGGENIITPQDLALAVVGSNRYPFWTHEDSSVPFPEGESFSETRLQYLGFNRSIPADSWIEVELWLDDLLYDPHDYKYITGFYIKNDPDFLTPFYIDDITLLLESNE